MLINSNHFANVDGPQAAPGINALSPTAIAYSAAKATANAAARLIESAEARTNELSTRKLALNSQLTELTNAIGQAEANTCRGWTGLVNRRCVDQKFNDIEGLTTRANEIKAQLARLDIDLLQSQKDRTQAVADFERAQRAMAESDPVLQATRANAAASVQIAAAKSASDVAEGKSKAMVYAGAALAGVIVLAIVLVAVLKRKS